jgi:hypothetical protein
MNHPNLFIFFISIVSNFISQCQLCLNVLLIFISQFGKFFLHQLHFFFLFVILLLTNFYTFFCLFYCRMSSGHQTLGRLPSHSAHMTGPNNGKYATLSKQCKTLESNDFY